MTLQKSLIADRGSILSLRGIGKRYGSIPVLPSIDLDIRQGEVLALIGENGAGKSTISAIIAGLVKPSSGTMSWRGAPYAPASPADALLAGIGLIHQEMRLLPDLSIAENVFVGRLPMKAGIVDRAAMNRRAAGQLKRLGLDVPPAMLVRHLRVAAQQQVEIAKALTLDASLLILDEPTAALGGKEADRLFEHILQLKAEGVSFIYISHRLDEIARVADRVAVLRDGQLVATHENAQVQVKTLVEQMVGRPVERMFPALRPIEGRPLLEIEGFTSPEGSFADVSFSVKAGEVFGIAGIIGAGRTELVRAIAGADPIASGTVKVGGAPIHLRSPRDALANSIFLVPEDRKAQGLILAHSIADNIAMSNASSIARKGWITPRAIERFADQVIARFGIKGRSNQRAGQLSGGNQQKVVIAKCISRRPRIVILDEPTRGIDVGARAAIYEMIADLAGQGMAVIVVSSDLDEVLGLSHRIMVLSRGRNRGILGHEAADRVTVMELATT